ncbi:MAG: esterase-like activity of phytase family protein [Myxococcales bacterium FL481]|nr:MAG: esterase-like activity of phytase family protein [Myxococcales bacterium FL481]
MPISSKLKTSLFAAGLACAGLVASTASAQGSGKSFRRIATMPVYLNTDIDAETVAEIVASTADGNTLVYTDGEVEGVGFVDITDPANPQPDGFTELEGEPTSVAVVGDYALVGVNTSDSFVAPSGHVAVVYLPTRTVVHTIALGGQPDSIAISADRRFAAVVLENERDEDIDVDGVEGGLPQAPGGLLVVLRLDGAPTDWAQDEVDLAGLADYAPEDPEPEYVDINDNNIAAVTLQENNHLVLVDLESGDIVNHWNCGTVDLDQVDTVEDDIIDPTSSLVGVPREPDAVTWIDNRRLATADEGDLFGGSRGFTVFNTRGKVVYTSGNRAEHTAIRVGHYPEGRSENKGNEPEAVEYGQFGSEKMLFVGSERASVIFVHTLNQRGKPRLKQVLPAGVGPEGLLAIPERNLLVVASEKDDRGDKLRGSVSIYQLADGGPTYPTLESSNRPDGTPIPWAALSGLTGSGQHTLWSVHDSAYKKSRIFKIDTRTAPAKIRKEIELRDSFGKLAAVEAGLDADQTLVNDDGSVNVDPEGITTGIRGNHFWVASEGRGTVGSGSRPFEYPNMLIKVARNGDILDVVELPEALAATQFRFGFEGVVAVRERREEVLYVPFQRAWEGAGDPEGHARIGRYVPSTGEWTFVHMPLAAAASPNGGWVGLSGIEYFGYGHFLLLMRDNQANTDAAVKHVVKVDLHHADFRSHGEVLDVVEPVLVRDLIADGTLTAPAGAVLEKIEGIAKLPHQVYVVNDNDAVDDSNGETLLRPLYR